MQSIGENISPLVYPLNYVVALCVGVVFFLLAFVISWPINCLFKHPELKGYALKGLIVGFIIATLNMYIFLSYVTVFLSVIYLGLISGLIYGHLIRGRS